MYRVALFAVGVLTVVAQPQGRPKCGRIAHGGMECCIKDLPQINMDDVKECFSMAKKPPSCDVDICIASKRGIASNDGTIDNTKMAAHIDKDFENDQDLADSIKENCVNGDLSKYGPANMCDLKKLKLCMDVQVIKSCDQWNEDGDCSGMKDLAAECVKEFD